MSAAFEMLDFDNRAHADRSPGYPTWGKVQMNGSMSFVLLQALMRATFQSVLTKTADHIDGLLSP